MSVNYLSSYSWNSVSDLLSTFSHCRKIIRSPTKRPSTGWNQQRHKTSVMLRKSTFLSFWAECSCFKLAWKQTWDPQLCGDGTQRSSFQPLVFGGVRFCNILEIMQSSKTSRRDATILWLSCQWHAKSLLQYYRFLQLEPLLMLICHHASF